MCIIIAKNKKDRLPTESELYNSFTYNSDGAGFMYVDKGRVIIDKGYMDYKKFLKRYTELCKKYNNFDNKCLVIHCRIGTSGGNTKGNCHPYPITTNIHKLHKTRLKTSIGVMHNGIITDYNPNDEEKKRNINDTQNFIRKYMYPLYSNWSNFYKNDNILKGLDDITNSKLAILDKDDNLYLVGKYVIEKGLAFSNDSYGDYRGYMRYYSNYDYYRDYWYDYEYKWNTNDKKEEDKKEELNNDNMIKKGEALYDEITKDSILLKKSDYIATGQDFFSVKIDNLLYYNSDLGVVYSYAGDDIIVCYDNCYCYDENYKEM